MRKLLILLGLFAGLAAAQCVPKYDAIQGRVVCAFPSSSGGSLSLLAGTIDPSGSCAGVSTSGLTLYANSTTPSLWYCNASGTWERIQSTTMVGSFIINGLTGTQPSTPATGYISCWMDSTLKLLECVDDAGTVSKIGGYYQNIEGGGKYLETVNTTVAPKRDNLQFRRGLDVWDDGVGTTIVDLNWLDLRTAPFLEEFYRVQGSSTSGTIGSYGWAFTTYAGTGATTTASATTWPNLGIQKVVSGSAAGSAGALCLDSGTGGSTTPFGALGANAGWGITIAFGLNATTNQRMYAGVQLDCSSGSMDRQRFMGVRFDQNATVPTPDTTNFSFYVKGDSGAGVALSSPLAADTNKHMVLMYSKVAGVIHFSLDAGADKTACAAGANNGGNCDLTITIPTSGMQPIFVCGTDTSSTQTCFIDSYRFDPHVAAFASNKRN
jgi:hypothetical protein